MTELPAKAGSEGYAACDDDGGLYCQKSPQLLLCHPAGFPCPLDGEPYIVKIKPSFISFNLHNIT